MIINRYKAMALLMLASGGVQGEPVPVLQQDPHVNELGFFDMHVCNWPERPQFFKILFSTPQYARVQDMVVFDPKGRELTRLQKQRYRPLERMGKPPKRVYMLDLEAGDDIVGGWYSIRVTDLDGKVHIARDLVPRTRLQGVRKVVPTDGAQAVKLPLKLTWDRVPGAQFYQVYVRDAWSDELVFQSKLLDRNEIAIPAGRLEPGGSYQWSVHARDVNEHILLGDFHNGSMSQKFRFLVAD